MGRPPAVVIVVRHGARLDAADKQWHLTSPTPYDPPLTYGGWTQSRALGQRIASILRSRETDNDTNEDTKPLERKRRHKVLIHTSPFLRCVQTGIAISAGVAQNLGHAHRRSESSTTFHSSPRMRPILTDSPRLAPIPEPFDSPVKTNGKGEHGDIKKSTMRVDAFLGEWLSPDYFELITPPPSSIMMVAGAKADLLRREDTDRLIHIRDMTAASSANPFVGFPGGWGSPTVKPIDIGKDEGPLSTMSSLSATLPRRDRTSSLSSVGSARSSQSHGSVKQSLAEHGVYNPPIPSYAISNMDAIPPGYVSHARDACVNVDYQWDSMRDPQNCGNGGEYGEEWSSMHKRFRRGIQHLINWYRDQDDASKLIPKLPPKDDTVEREEDDEDIDLVVIFVTHGAGCNALIGALTNQPVLLDVGMASLTMAVHTPPKITPSSTPVSTPKAHSRSGSRVLNLSDEYEVKLVANTEHLRSSSTSTPSTSRSPSLGIPTNRTRFVDNNNQQPPQARSMSSVYFGGVRRSATVATTPLRTYVPARNNSIGLWTAPKSPEEPGPVQWSEPKSPEEEEPTAEEPGDDMVLNFGDGGTDLPLLSDMENEATPKKDHIEEDHVPEMGGPGLWGKPKAMAEAGLVLRDNAPKRRWTVNERGA